jgi:hypothetical protein
MLLSICPKIFGDQHIDMTLENRGITISFRVGYTSSLIVPSYSSNASLDATIVVVIAKWSVNELALVEQSKLNEFPCLIFKQQG